MQKLLTILLLSGVWSIHAQNTNYNYTEERTYTDENASESEALINIVYYDGLGRPIQEVQKGASPVDGQDIIKHIEYEPNIGQVKDYLPYAGSGFNFAANAKQETLSFYNTAKYQNTANPYSENRLEDSPSQRVLETAAPGNDWAMDAGEKHTIRYDYDFNKSNEVRLYTTSTTWNSSRGAYVSTIASNGYYLSNSLHKTVVKNENWKATDGKNNTTEEFKGVDGNVVLKRTYNNGVAHDTYYVHDLYGNLSYVLPPLANGSVSSTTLNKLCYQYRYDEKNRLVEKKLPAKDWEYIVYDKADRIVMTGPVYSPFGSGNKGWLFTKYDATSRVVYTGYYDGHSVTANNRKTIKDAVYAQTDNNENKTSSNQTIDGVSIRYGNTKFPTSSIKLLTVNYYDDYNYPNAPTSFPSIGGEATVQTVKGLPTGNWTRVVTTTSERKATQSYTIYNAKYQPLRTYSKNHLNGYTKTDSEFTFTGLPTKATTKHKRTSSDAELTIVNNYTYDNQLRLTKHSQKTANQSEQLITENVYDDLGTLITKNVGGLEVASNPLQKVDYKYNVRGWLTDINNLQDGDKTQTDQKDLFHYRIKYNSVFNNDDETQSQYNGNISSIAWQTKTDNTVRGYAYDYDHLNRLQYASHLKLFQAMVADPIFPGGRPVYRLISNYSRTGQYAEDLTYDKNGNILSLDRFGEEVAGQPIEIDELTYTYDGNRLLKVVDGTNNDEGFKDGDNTGNDYTYDTMGNLLTDQNKSITSIKYNHLNLPTQVIFETGAIIYTYDATGTKLRKIVEPYSGTTVTTDYLGGFQYEDNDLQFFFQPEGYVKKDNNNYLYVFQYKDHLGNVRLSYADCNNDGVIQPSSEILEENNYYPFGLKHQGYNELANANRSEQAEKYQYNGKEFEDNFGLNIYAMDLRQYDPAIGRWVVQDPVIHHEFSPYNAFDNNPVYWADPSGADAIGVTIADLFNAADSGTTFLFDNGELIGQISSPTTVKAFLQSVYEATDIGTNSNGAGGSSITGDGNGGGNLLGNRIVENGTKVLEAKTSLLGKIWGTLEPREWTDRETGFVYQVNADGNIMGLRPLGGLGVLGLISGPGAVKLMKFGGDEAISHFTKHAKQIMKVNRLKTYNLANYVDDANWIIQNGSYSSKLNGYYYYMGNTSKGESLFGFVGLKNGGSTISTFHVKTAKQLGMK